MNVEKIEKISLGEFPTPLMEMKNLSKKHGKGRMFIKRDDVTGPALGGNKTRKLEYIMKDALDRGYTAILTTGAPGTGHGRTTISAARQCGLKPILVRKGKDPDYLDGNLAVDALLGCAIYSTEGDLDEAVKKVIAQYEAAGEKVYNLPAKSSTEVGAAGYMMCIREIMEQCQEMDIHPKYLVASAASLGTYAGLVCGAEYFHAPFQVIGIPSFPLTKDDKKEAAFFINELAEYYQLNFTMTQYYLNLQSGPADHPYYGDLEAPIDPDALKTMIELAESEGIILDPEYTARAFHGFLDLVDRDVIKGDAIFLHTGGGQSVWSKSELDAMQETLRASCTIQEI